MTRRTLWIDFLLYPAHTLPTAAAPVVVGVGLAIHDHVFALRAALLGFLASWFIHLGGVFMDNHRLLARHADLREHPEMTDALARGLITLPGLRQATIVCFVLAALSGASLVSAVGVVAPALGLIGTVASLGYCVGRYAWTRLGIADIVFFLMFGVVAVAGIYYVQAAPHHGPAGGWRFLPAALPLPAWVLGLPVGAIVTNVLLIDDMRDREFDALKG